MTDIRKYIDLVQEGFGYNQQQPRAFGRKNTSFSPEPPTDPKKVAELEDCKRCRSAEQYDDEHNPFYPVHNIDPQSVKDRAEEYSEELKARWHHYKNAGYF